MWEKLKVLVECGVNTQRGCSQLASVLQSAGWKGTLYYSGLPILPCIVALRSGGVVVSRGLVLVKKDTTRPSRLYQTLLVS